MRKTLEFLRGVGRGLAWVGAIILAIPGAMMLGYTALSWAQYLRDNPNDINAWGGTWAAAFMCCVIIIAVTAKEDPNEPSH